MIQIKLANGQVLWTAHVKQETVLTRTEDEILFGGARGGGKTAAGIIWLIMGNTEPTGTVADAGYYLHPNYRALVLRKNINDMGDWIEKAKAIYKPLGGNFVRFPVPEFRFPSGAIIVIGHLDDSDAYEKYQGQEFARILIEELTQIPNPDLYLKVLASNRSPFDELRKQVFCTSNPGGPGHSWVRDRFIVPVPPYTAYIDARANNRSRIYIPARVQDNPIYANDAQYIGTLMGLSPSMRAAWLEGNWDAIGGQFFQEWRTEPREGEPPCAQHIVTSTEVTLEPWYHRWLGCDWGYAHKAAVYKAAQLPSGQVHIYDELVMDHTTPEELGVEIARFVWSDLQAGGQKTFQMVLSPDAFHKRTSERTIADQIAVGINKILGSDSVYIMPPSSDSASDIFSIATLQHSASIVIQRAQDHRVSGWMYMHSLMRWWPLLGDRASQFDPAIALRLHEQDKIKWLKYLDLFRTPSETLPMLRVHGDKCPHLIRAIPLAMAEDPDKGDPNDVVKKHWEGADSADACRYLLHYHKFMEIRPPMEQHLASHFAKYAPQGTDGLSGTSKMMMALKAEADWRRLNAPAFAPIHVTTTRSGAARWRRSHPPKEIS